MKTSALSYLPLLLVFIVGATLSRSPDFPKYKCVGQAVGGHWHRGSR